MGVGAWASVMTSCGAVAPVSRLARLICEPVVVSAKLYSPLPVTYEVTSMDVHVPVVNGPDDPIAGVVKAGALEYVIVVSPQVLSATAFAAYPALEELLA